MLEIEPTVCAFLLVLNTNAANTQPGTWWLLSEYLKAGRWEFICFLAPSLFPFCLWCHKTSCPLCLWCHKTSWKPKNIPTNQLSRSLLVTRKKLTPRFFFFFFFAALTQLPVMPYQGQDMRVLMWQNVILNLSDVNDNLSGAYYTSGFVQELHVPNLVQPYNYPVRWDYFCFREDLDTQRSKGFSQGTILVISRVYIWN